MYLGGTISVNYLIWGYASNKRLRTPGLHHYFENEEILNLIRMGGIGTKNVDQATPLKASRSSLVTVTIIF
jgi:hypothetical protein